MAEAGHQSGRVFIDQDGSFNLNSAAFKNDADVDISGELENVRFMVQGIGQATALSTGLKMTGGTVVNSSGGLTDVVTGLSQIFGASANILSTAAPTTAAGVPQQCSVGYSTASGTLQILALKYTSTANTQLIAATSTGFSMGWTAFGL